MIRIHWNTADHYINDQISATQQQQQQLKDNVHSTEMSHAEVQHYYLHAIL